MNLGEFHSLLLDELNKGSVPTNYVPGATRRAVKWLERNFTLQYMKRFQEFTLDSTLVNARAVNLPTKTKQIYFIRWVSDADASGNRLLNYVPKVLPSDVTRRSSGPPELYWLDANETIWFNNTPDENYTCEIYYAQYSTWPDANDEYEHWLLDQGEDLLFYQTLMGCAHYLREPDLLTAYTGLRDQALKSVIDSEIDLEFSGGSGAMNYGQDYENEQRL